MAMPQMAARWKEPSLRSGQQRQAEQPQTDHQAAADQVVDGAGDDGIEHLGDDRAKERSKAGAKEADQAADLEDAPQQHAADAGGVLQGHDQGSFQRVDGLLEPGNGQILRFFYSQVPVRGHREETNETESPPCPVDPHDRADDAGHR